MFKVNGLILRWFLARFYRDIFKNRKTHVHAWKKQMIANPRVFLWFLKKN